MSYDLVVLGGGPAVESGQGDHDKDHDGQHDLCVAGYVVDQFIEMFADLVIDGSSVFHR